MKLYLKDAGDRLCASDCKDGEIKNYDWTCSNNCAEKLSSDGKKCNTTCTKMGEYDDGSSKCVKTCKIKDVDSNICIKACSKKLSVDGKKCSSNCSSFDEYDIGTNNCSETCPWNKFKDPSTNKLVCTKTCHYLNSSYYNPVSYGECATSCSLYSADETSCIS